MIRPRLTQLLLTTATSTLRVNEAFVFVLKLPLEPAATDD